jgi:hypothetical protein
MKNNTKLYLLLLIILAILIIIYLISQKNRQENFGILTEIGCILNSCDIIKCKAGLLTCKGCSVCEAI